VRLGTPAERGPGRLGFFRGDTVYAFLEFSFADIPADFRRLDDRGAALASGDSLHGIDAIRLALRFSGNSAIGGHAPRAAQLRISACERESLVVRNARFLLSVPLSVTGTGDSAVVDTAFGDSSRLLFDYVREKLLSFPADSADTPRVALLLSLEDPSKNDALLSLNPDVQPALTLYGKSAPVYCGILGDSLYCWNGDSLVDDSAVGALRRSFFYLSPTNMAGRDSLFSQIPVLSTVSYQIGDSVRYHGARFRLSLDTLFQGLDLDSVDILSATACFIPADTAGGPMDSYGEAGRFSLDLVLSASLRDGSGAEVKPVSGLFAAAETLYLAGYTSGLTDTIAYPIHKYLAALMDPRYRTARAIEFNLFPLPVFNTFNQIVFQSKAVIRFEYAKRFPWKN
jgi:hypothetical protein